MKILKYIPIAFLALFASCDSDLDKVTFEGDAVPSTLSAIASSYVLEEDKASEVAETFKWTAADYGYNASVTYSVEVDLAGEEFANKRVLASTIGDTEISVTQEELNQFILDLDTIYKIEPNTRASYEIRISSSIGTVVAPVYSNVFTTEITTYYVDPTPQYPENLYMVGADFGNWSWTDEGVVEMVPVHSTEGTFWAIKYLTASHGMKWSATKTWDDAFGTLDTNEGFTNDGDGNAIVDTDGLYMIYIDMPNSKITIQPAEVYGMGDCFGGWSMGTYPFIHSGDKMSITTTGAGEIRMYAAYPALGGDWWKMEFVFFDGKIAYRGKGDDQDRVQVAAGTTVTLDFNAGTATMQ